MPPAALRFAGREPRFIVASAEVGVAAWKYREKIPPSDW